MKFLFKLPKTIRVSYFVCHHILWQWRVLFYWSLYREASNQKKKVGAKKLLCVTVKQLLPKKNEWMKQITLIRLSYLLPLSLSSLPLSCCQLDSFAPAIFRMFIYVQLCSQRNWWMKYTLKMNSCYVLNIIYVIGKSCFFSY